jgi:nicotinate-nucleotide adenylyltransferase
VPAGQPWQKTRPMTEAAHREAMLRLAIAHEPRFVLDRIELERSGPSYTLDTVRALKAAHPGTEWHLLIGHDQHAGLHTWHHWQELLGLVVLAVANRPDSEGNAGAASPRPVHPEVLRHGFQTVPLPLLNIAATQVRHLAAQGADIDTLATLVPTEVAGYIYHHGLYRPAIRS